MIEREIKIMLTDREYAAVLSAMYIYDNPTVQTNYYFDTEDFQMNKKAITCRIRCKDGVYKATVKKHNIGTDCSVEYDLCTGCFFDTSVFNAPGLIYHGNLTTERTYLHREKSCTMVLDKNSYLGITDYELEIEYTHDRSDSCRRQIKDIVEILLDSQCITSEEEFMSRISAGKTKSERFFEEKQNKNFQP